MKDIIRPLMVGVALAAACILPAAQEATPIPPEATETPIPPEATALPEGVVFATPGFCLISPDETNVAVWRDGVYDLPSGAKRFDLPEVDWVRHSPDGRHLIVSEVGLYETATGELLIPSENHLYLPGVGEFSPDGRWFVDGNIVYDLTTLEQVTTLARNAPTYGDEDPLYGEIEFVNDGRWLAFDRFDAEHEAWVKVYVEIETWETILDGGDYPSGMGLRFSNDYTRYAVGGEGVFSYPSGEKLFDLPRGQVEFSEDSSVILVRTAPPTLSEPVILTYVDAASGEEINRFEIPLEIYVQLQSRGLLDEPTMTRAVVPVITQVGVGQNMNPLVRGWQVVEIATGAVLNEFEDIEFLTSENANPVREALLLLTPEDWSVNGRYVVWGEGVFDVETDALILPLERDYLTLSAQAAYVYTTTICTIWELP